MVVDFEVDPRLGPDWQKQVMNRIYLQLAFAEREIQTLTVSVELEAGATLFACKLIAELVSGETDVVEMRGADASICFADGTARLSRTIRRRSRLSHARAVLH